MDLLNSGLVTTLEVMIRVALKRDPATLRRLARLDGRVIAVNISAPAVRFCLLPSGEGLELSAGNGLESDCEIEGAASDFLKVLLDEQKTFGSGITLSGDTELAVELKNCLQKLDIDWEGMLGDRIGDLAAHQLAEIARSFRGYARQTAGSLLDDIDDYLHEEVRLVPPQAELDQFCDQIDELRLRVDRLQARVSRLSEPQQDS